MLWDHIFVRKTGEDSVRRMVSMTYTIPTHDGSALITVCKETFLKVLRVSKVRIHNVLRKYFPNTKDMMMDPGGSSQQQDQHNASGNNGGTVIEILDDSEDEMSSENNTPNSHSIKKHRISLSPRAEQR